MLARTMQRERAGVNAVVCYQLRTCEPERSATGDERPRTARRLVACLALVASTACSGGSQSAAPPALPPTPVTLQAAKAIPIEETSEHPALLKSLHRTPLLRCPSPPTALPP